LHILPGLVLLHFISSLPSLQSMRPLHLLAIGRHAASASQKIYTKNKKNVQLYVLLFTDYQQKRLYILNPLMNKRDSPKISFNFCEAYVIKYI
jgi:hypothetical protein